MLENRTVLKPTSILPHGEIAGTKPMKVNQANGSEEQRQKGRGGMKKRSDNPGGGTRTGRTITRHRTQHTRMQGPTGRRGYFGNGDGYNGPER